MNIDTYLCLYPGAWPLLVIGIFPQWAWQPFGSQEYPQPPHYLPEPGSGKALASVSHPSCKHRSDGEGSGSSEPGSGDCARAWHHLRDVEQSPPEPPGSQEDGPHGELLKLT